MSKISDIINEAEGALSVKNEALAIRILIEALRAIEAGRARITPEETGAVWDRWRRGDSIERIASITGYAVCRVATITRKLKRLYPHDRRTP